MDLTAVFRELLAHHDYVSLPGLGSFVRLYEPASLADEGCCLRPPCERYAFDPSRTFNDNALEHHLHEVQGLSAQEADEQVKRFVDSVTISLSSGREVRFVGLGALRVQPDGRIALEALEAQESATFGLPELAVAPRAVVPLALKADVAPIAAPSDVEPRPVPTPSPSPQPAPAPPRPDDGGRGRWVGIAAALLAVAAIALLVLLYKPLHFWEQSAASAPESMVAKANEAPAGEPDSMARAVNVSPAAAALEVSTDQKNALLYTEGHGDEAQQTYYIVVGSYSQKANASRQMSSLEAKGYRPTLLYDEQLYRVALYKFTNRDRAMRELERLRAQNISSTVWLYSI